MTLYVRSGGVYQTVDFNNFMRKDAGGTYVTAKELLVRDAGTWKNVWRADGPPPAPTSLSAAAANGGIINVSWAYPANVENDYNRVEVQQGGDVARIATGYAGTTQQRTGYGHGQGVFLEARTVDNGGQVSAWVPINGVTTLNAGPPAPVLTAFFWDGTYWNVQWNDPANPYGDNSTMQVFIRNANEDWVLAWSGSYTGGGGRLIQTAGRGWDIANYAFVRVFNSAGYADSNVAGQWTPPAPGTEKVVGSFEGNSWAFAAGAYRHDGTVRQGQFAPTPMGLHFGLFFYGDELYNVSHGYPAQSAEILMIRNGTEGFTGPVNFTGHGYGWNPGVAPTGDGNGWVSQSDFAGADASYWEPLPIGLLQGFAAGTSKGVGIFTFSAFQSNYKVFKGPQINGFAGAIRLRW